MQDKTSFSLAQAPSSKLHLIWRRFKAFSKALHSIKIFLDVIISLTESTAKNLYFLSRGGSYLSPPNFLSLYKSQVKPNPEYCSNTNLTNRLPTLAHRRFVGHDELTTIIPPLAVPLAAPLAVHTPTTRTIANIYSLNRKIKNWSYLQIICSKLWNSFSESVCPVPHNCQIFKRRANLLTNSCFAILEHGGSAHFAFSF